MCVRGVHFDTQKRNHVIISTAKRAAHLATKKSLKQGGKMDGPAWVVLSREMNRITGGRRSLQVENHYPKGW